ncbi:MAG: hypothetical protein KJ066_08835 [Acidobacteria bacterium]|nr:hypothetical protein [Acidobacteriota bacterium]
MTGVTPCRRRLAHRVGPPLATVVLTATAAMLATWPLAREMASATLRDGEVLLTAWQINSYHHALLSAPWTWLDANIFFPYDRASTFNDLLLAHALVTLPAGWADSPVLALNLALLGGIVLCGVFASLLVDELVDAPWIAAVAGTLFALTPFRFLHLGHLSMAAAWAVPLFLWALLAHLRQPSWSRAALASASGVLVGLSSVYLAVYVAPIVPVLLLVGARRGPGGRAAWMPLLVTAVPGLVLLAACLVPYAATLDAFGVAAAPGDLVRYGADLTSLRQRPEFLAGSTPGVAVDPEAQLYPGAALGWLSAAGLLAAVASTLRREEASRWHLTALLTLALGAGLGVAMPLDGVWREAWRFIVLALIWVGPVLAFAWAFASVRSRQPTRPQAAIRLGIAGAAVTFALALGPEARHATETIGPAPYSLLTSASRAFEGTRVPARFGGLTILFLAIASAGLLAGLARSRQRLARWAGVVAAALALVATARELPVPPLPEGLELVEQTDLHHPAYRWLRQQQGQLAILELPDWPTTAPVGWEFREWRALRYMLASKQHGQHLANGSGRIEPLLWSRFRQNEPWSDAFFGFITAYFPVDYVLLHEAGLPPDAREVVRARIARRIDGWNEVFSGGGVSVFTVDRSFGQGTRVDRLVRRRDASPVSEITFSVRRAPPHDEAPGHDASNPVVVDLFRDDEPVGSWPLDGEWREVVVRIPVGAVSPAGWEAWPRTTTLLRWQAREGAFELRNLRVGRWEGGGS